MIVQGHGDPQNHGNRQNEDRDKIEELKKQFDLDNLIADLLEVDEDDVKVEFNPVIVRACLGIR